MPEFWQNNGGVFHVCVCLSIICFPFIHFNALKYFSIPFVSMWWYVACTHRSLDCRLLFVATAARMEWRQQQPQQQQLLQYRWINSRQRSSYSKPIGTCKSNLLPSQAALLLLFCFWSILSGFVIWSHKQVQLNFYLLFIRFFCVWVYSDAAGDLNLNAMIKIKNNWINRTNLSHESIGGRKGHWNMNLINRFNRCRFFVSFRFPWVHTIRDEMKRDKMKLINNKNADLENRFSVLSAKSNSKQISI